MLLQINIRHTINHQSALRRWETTDRSDRIKINETIYAEPEITFKRLADFALLWPDDPEMIALDGHVACTAHQ